MRIEVSRLHKLDGSGSTRAFCDISIEDILVIKGLRIVEGTDGLFVSMPREEGKDGKWYNVVIPLTRAVKDEIESLVLNAYNGDDVSVYNHNSIRCNNCQGTGYVNQAKES